MSSSILPEHVLRFNVGSVIPQFSIRSQQKEKYNILELFIAGISDLIWSIERKLFAIRRQAVATGANHPLPRSCHRRAAPPQQQQLILHHGWR